MTAPHKPANYSTVAPYLIVDGARLTQEQSEHNAEMILSDVKTHLLDEITASHSVFTRRQIPETLARRVEEPEAFTALLATALEHDELVALAPERRNERDEVVNEARYSTKTLIAAERQNDRRCYGPGGGTGPRNQCSRGHRRQRPRVCTQ